MSCPHQFTLGADQLGVQLGDLVGGRLQDNVPLDLQRRLVVLATEPPCQVAFRVAVAQHVVDQLPRPGGVDQRPRCPDMGADGEDLGDRLGPCPLGATVDDLSSDDASFQAVQCLIDHGFADKYGMVSSNLIRPNEALTRAEMYTIIFEVLEILNSKMQPIKEKINNTRSCIVYHQNDSMKSIIRTLLAKFSILPSAHAQVTSINQFSDVKPTDPYYVPISLFIDKWGVLTGYPNGTLMGGQAATYGELVQILNASLDRFTETNDELKRLCREIEKENALK